MKTGSKKKEIKDCVAFLVSYTPSQQRPRERGLSLFYSLGITQAPATQEIKLGLESMEMDELAGDRRPIKFGCLKHCFRGNRQKLSLPRKHFFPMRYLSHIPVGSRDWELQRVLKSN